MKSHLHKLLLLAVLSTAPLGVAEAASAALLGWNNLGMHCMDSSYSEFSILPPYNTIEAQLVVGGKLVKSGGNYRVSYEAVADPDGSINRTSIGKGNWQQFESVLFGVPNNFTADMGLAGWNMPGPLNTPQAMLFETANSPAPGVSTLVNWFRAEGIPITPYDDAHQKNPYPLMRLVARDANNAVVAQSDIVLPVSDEMDCRMCHGAGTHPAAMPLGGWIVDPNADREYRLNILKLHDDAEFANHPALYAEALAAKGLNAQGLYASTLAGQPMLCASCHSSEALGAPSFTSTHGNGTVSALTTAVHRHHAPVMDPVLHVTLNDSANRASCYRCHPGSTTRCLRGAMGSAVAPDGTLSMQCQSCHGDLLRVGSSSRVGWLMEPNCQSCHTGTATKNSGQIRYTSVFDSNGQERVPADTTFATTANTPAPGLSLYRFSVGHGGLQCSACHGSTHAEFPASHRNDNLRNLQLQGHVGVLADCTACHTSMPSGAAGGPHGLHPMGQAWVEGHHDALKQVGLAACQACHGQDYRGTELSRMQAARTFRVGDAGNQSFYRGATIGCYTCHQGPSSSSMNNRAAPVLGNVVGSTQPNVSVSMPIPALTAGVTLRVITQPQNGTVAIANGVVTYFPFEGFTGTDTFTYAGYDGAKNSALATGIVVVGQGPPPSAPVITTNPQSRTATVGESVTFNVVATGTPTLEMQWYKNQVAIPGAVGASLTLNPVSTSDAAAYTVTVRNVLGSVTSSAARLTVLVPPTVSSFTPASGPVGTTVTINGSRFASPATVKFNGTAATQVTVNSSSRITAVVPTGATTGPISVTTASGTGKSAGSFTVTLPVPRVTSFTPSSGTAGTTVTIQGANLNGASSVTFNGVSARFTVVSPTTLSVIVPSGNASGRIKVTTPGGSATSSSSFSVRTRSR